MRAALAVSLFVLVLAACDAGIPGETRLPRCEPRSSADSGRLNIDTGAERFGLDDPCRSSVRFYIAANTPVRSLDAEVVLTDGHGERMASRSIVATFEDSSAGMYIDAIELAPVPGTDCRRLQARIEGLSCRDAVERVIECPTVRLKTSYVFRDLTIDAAALDVCYD